MTCAGHCILASACYGVVIFLALYVRSRYLMRDAILLQCRLSKRLSSQHDIHELERTKLREEAEEAKRMLRLSEEENKKLKKKMSEASFDPAAARIRAHVDHLKAENEELKKSNEELSDQLAQEISEARLLVYGAEESSIAEELTSATRDEVMDALKKQEQINDQLKSYLERITLSILERNPEILEIK